MFAKILKKVVFLLAPMMLVCGGCTWFDFEERAKPQDLVLDLGKVELRLIWLEEMQLLVGKYEITNQQFRQFKPAHNSGEHEGNSLNEAKQPAVNVSWKDAAAFCDWLNKEHGTQENFKYNFRLPTEKEWMTFTACGNAYVYPWGDELPPPASWNYFGEENRTVGQKLERADKFQVSAPVRRSGINEWGLYGTGGNVWEWTSAKEGEKSYIFKGGSWSDYIPLFLRLDRQSSYEPTYRYINLGFRIVAERLPAESN